MIRLGRGAPAPQLPGIAYLILPGQPAMVFGRSLHELDLGAGEAEAQGKKPTIRHWSRGRSDDVARKGQLGHRPLGAGPQGRDRFASARKPLGRWYVYLERRSQPCTSKVAGEATLKHMIISAVHFNSENYVVNSMLYHKGRCEVRSPTKAHSDHDRGGCVARRREGHHQDILISVQGEGSRPSAFLEDDARN